MEYRRYAWCTDCNRLLGRMPKNEAISRYCPYCAGDIEITTSAWLEDDYMEKRTTLKW